MPSLPRLASHFLTFAFALIAFATAINALVKSNHQKSQLRAAAAPATVDIDTSDVFASGVVVTVVCGLLALTALAALAVTALPRAAATRTAHRALGGLFAFLTLWLFATIIPFTDFVATGQASVSAYLGDVPLPASVIQAAEQALGASPVYHKLNYLRIAAAFPWIAFMFGAISAALELTAQPRAPPPAQYPAAQSVNAPTEEKKAGTAV